VPPRFLLLADVAEILNVSAVQARALVKSGELPAIKVGGRGQWRIEASELEAYIQRKYAETRALVRACPGPTGTNTLDDLDASDDPEDRPGESGPVSPPARRPEGIP
jgi:excisionase family DNA binding protein